MRSSTDNQPTLFLGIDNGPSGSVGVQEYNVRGMRYGMDFFETPTYMLQDYTKAKKRISQLDMRFMRKYLRKYKEGWNIHIAMERPLVNPQRFNASAVGLRVHQQWLDLFLFLRFPAPVSLDSKEWQKPFLPVGTSGDELKRSSKEIGMKLFPKHAEAIRKHKDADGMFISEWMRRSIMGGMKK